VGVERDECVYADFSSASLYTVTSSANKININQRKMARRILGQQQ
jgi:hypothetical protein